MDLGHVKSFLSSEDRSQESISQDRRKVLMKTGIAMTGAAALAGCNDGQTEDPLPNGTPGTDTPTQTTENTPTDEPKETPQEEGEIENQADPNLSFEQVYTMTEDEFQSEYTEAFDPNAQHLEEGEINVVLEQDEKIDQLEKAKEIIIENDDVNPRDIGSALKEVAYNQLEYDTEEVVIDPRATGGGGKYFSIFTKEDGDWQKSLNKLTYLLKDGEEPTNKNEELLHDIWNQDIISKGAATGFETWREGVERSNFFTERMTGPRSGLASMRNLNYLTDEIIVNDYKRETDAEGNRDANFGDISFTRPVANMMRDIQDFDENEVFNAEVELTKNLTEFYHGSYEPDENTFIQVATEEELKTDLEEDVADKPYQLTTLDETTLYASEINRETHKENIWNNTVPESQFPEHEYPGNVKLPEEILEDK
ncbi:MAG: hypothetical protein ACI9LV_000178 [Candidatus Nanohaloarchaea archaeon]|jgi:hypothetical protein